MSPPLLATLALVGWSPAPSFRPHSVRSSQRHVAVRLSDSQDAVIQQRVANGLSHVVLGQADELLKSRDTGPADKALSVPPGGLIDALLEGRGGKFVDDAYYILLFPSTEQHVGVYTLQGKEPDEASTLTYVLAFEQLGDAVRFAALLQAQGLSAPAPTERTAEQLVEFCGKAGLRLLLARCRCRARVSSRVACASRLVLASEARRPGRVLSWSLEGCHQLQPVARQKKRECLCCLCSVLCNTSLCRRHVSSKGRPVPYAPS